MSAETVEEGGKRRGAGTPTAGDSGNASISPCSHLAHGATRLENDPMYVRMCGQLNLPLMSRKRERGGIKTAEPEGRAKRTFTNLQPSENDRIGEPVTLKSGIRGTVSVAKAAAIP